MAGPEFPKIPQVPEEGDVASLLVHTIALEELALAALVQAEAATIKHMVEQGIAGPILPEEAIRINESVRDVLIAAAKKESILLQKLRILLACKDQHGRPLPSPCKDETAWAAEAVGQTRFVKPGNWATYIQYCKGDASEENPREYPLYAGQHHRAGSLWVWNEQDILNVVYFSLGADSDYLPGHKGKWSILSVHVHAGSSPQDIPRTTVGSVLGGPIPGQFEYKWSEEEDGSGAWQHVVDPLDVLTRWDNENCIIIAAHAEMVWCPKSEYS